MRVIECNLCGDVLSAASDEELVAVTRRHMAEQHADSQVGDEQVRELVDRGAYDATDS